MTQHCRRWGLRVFFFKTRPIVESLARSTILSSTTLFSSNRKVQRTLPLGGLEQARAINLERAGEASWRSSAVSACHDGRSPRFTNSRVSRAPASGAARPTVQNADVIGALESWRLAEALAAHLAADVADRRHAARVEPFSEAGEEGAHMADAVAQQRRSRHHDLCAHQQVFDRLIRALDASRRGERAAHLSREHADPQQRQPYLRRRAEVKAAAEPHREKIDVGLV